MDPNTHGAFITGGNFSAFVDGIPDTCEHDSKGDIVMQSASGKVIYWHTYRQWAHLTTKARQILVHEYHEQIEDHIVMGTTSCSKCKKIFNPPLF
mgnify:CR=1 FL=1